MDRITRFSLKNPTVIVITALLVLFMGLYSAGNLKRETMPDVSIPIVAVVTPYPGAAPQDVYDRVTLPVEQALGAVAGLTEVSSSSADSVSIVVLSFGYSVDMDEAEDEIVSLLDGVALPDNALDPDTVRVTFGSAPILKLSASGGQSVDELRAAVSDIVLPGLSAIDGVGDLKTTDEAAGTISITFDPDALSDRGLTASDVMQQVQAANLSFPVGSVMIDGGEEPVRVGGTIETLDDVKNLSIVIYPDANAMYGEAFESMGEGMGALGSAVGQLGGAVGQLGVAVGDVGAGLGQVSQGLGTQLGLVAALQDTEADLLEAKLALSEANAVLRDPAASAEETMVAGATVEQLSSVIPALEGAVAGIKAELQAVQAAAAAQAASAASSPAPSAPSMSAPSALSAPSSASMEMPELEIVRLSDLAEVVYESGAESTYARINGDRAVLIDIIKSQEANTVDVSEDTIAAVEEINDRLPEGIELTLTYDAAIQINNSIRDMVQEGLLGAIFAFIVILLFLRNWRSTLISAISIPLSVIGALAFIGQFGITLNVMTLGGLTVAIGRVVDDSIVVIENIYRHLQIGDTRTAELVRVATREVSTAITSSTLTTIAVFAPMALVSGIVGKVFTPFAITVALALFASLIVSVTIVPLVAKWVLLNAKVPPRDEAEARTSGGYGRVLAWSLSHKRAVVAAAVLLFIVSIALIPLIGTGFMPPSAEKFATIDVAYPSGTPAEIVDGTLQQVEEAVSELDDIVYYQASVGTASGFDVVAGDNKGSLFLKYEDEADMDSAIEILKDAVEPFKSDDVRVAVAQVDVSGAGANSIDLVVTGPTSESLETAAAAIESMMEGIEGLENVSSNVSESRKQITIEVDQEKAAEKGLNAGIVLGAVRGFVAEESAGTVTIDGMQAELLYSTDIGEIESVDTIAHHQITAPLGDVVEIADVALVQEVETPVSVLALDGNEYVAVSASVVDRDSSTVIAAITEELASMDLPDGVEVQIAGMAEMMNEAFEQLGLAMVIAVAAVFLVMVIAFGEAVAPLAIMVSLPLAIIGGIIGLAIVRLPLDMPAMIGALMLIGIVTTNAIVLIERVIQKLDEGLPRREALLVAGTDRIRPVLMTALTTIMALMPMASGFAEGALMSQSLAVIVVGGLTTSTALTLIVVPVVYDILEGLKDRIFGEDYVERMRLAD